MSDWHDVLDLEEFKALLGREPAVLAYFSTPGCNVCQVLKPRVLELLNEKFQRMRPVYVDCEARAEVSAQYQVFAVPSVLVFFDGRESLRKGRNFGLAQLQEELARPYEMLFAS